MQIPESNAKLKEGVAAWNAWHREKLLTLPRHGKQCINLHPADLSGMDLRGANFERTSFFSANLQGANLSGANFREADLRAADFSGANFSNTSLEAARCAMANFTGANFTGADLSYAFDFSGDFCQCDFTGANLAWVDFRDADLQETNFHGAILFENDFNRACMDRTKLVDVDLSRVTRLEDVRHYGPSLVDTNTILKSRGEIPHSFLKGCGLSDEFIRNIRSLIFDTEPADSCLICYWNLDNEFVRRLYAHLWKTNTRCDLFACDLRKLPPDCRRVHDFDRLILVFSQHAAYGEFLEPVVKVALKKEFQWKRPVLFPVQVDDLKIDDSRPKIETGWVAGTRDIRRMFDFRDWRNPVEYQRALDGLMHGMGMKNKTRIPS
jgi:uncharacterized protein YjbI with pentapeptide repeats